MMLGLSFQAFALLHVALSLVAIVAGLVALIALARRVWLDTWHQIFLATTAATLITGFMFPISVVTPALIVGAITSVVLAIAIIAYIKLPSASWSPRTYAASAMTALYFNLFVLVAQAFMKIPLLNRLAPTQSEPPFAGAQVVLLIASVTVGFYAIRGSRLRSGHAA